jgi:hypothetical protein
MSANGVCGDMQSPQLDRFARDARAWRDLRENQLHRFSRTFWYSNLFLYFTVPAKSWMSFSISGAGLTMPFIDSYLGTFVTDDIEMFIL